MDLESSVGNRVSFERCRTVIEQSRDRLSPSVATDYQYKLGTGLARFGQTGRARTALTAGLDLAERHRLNAWYFKIEAAIKELVDQPEQQTAAPEASELSEAPAVREMEIGLREYAAAATL
jgi:hypothetical protein